jgi:hypothetical protein
MPTYTYPNAGTIISKALSETLGSSASQPTALQNDVLLQELDIINSEWVETAQVNHPSKGWSWLSDKKGYNTITPSTLSVGIAAGTTTLNMVDASQYDDSGAVMVTTSKGGTSIIEYTGKTPTSLTGASGVLLKHDANSVVYPLLALPDDCLKIKEVYVDGSEYHFNPQGAYGSNYIVIDNYLVLPTCQQEKEVVVLYEKKNTVIADTNDLISAPTQYLRYHVEKLKEYIFNVRRMEDKESLARAKALEVITRALTLDTTPTTEQQGFRPSW